MTEFTDAIAYERSVGIPVDVVAVLAAERCVQTVADATQTGPRPVARFPGSRHPHPLLRSGEITTAVDVDVGAGHVGVAPGGEKRDDGPDFVRRARASCRRKTD